MVPLQTTYEYDCDRQVYHGEEMQCQDTTNLWAPIVNWWHGGNAENEGTRFGAFWCAVGCQDYDSYTYDFRNDVCACVGSYNPPPLWRFGGPSR